MLHDLFAAAVLIACLDSNSFRAREDASAKIEAMGDRALPSLQLFRSRSPEQALRIRRLIEARRPAMIRRLLARHDPLPEIEGLPEDYRDVAANRFGVIDRLLSQLPEPVWSGDENDDDGKLWEADWLRVNRLATALYVGELASRGESEEKIARLLDRMAGR